MPIRKIHSIYIPKYKRMQNSDLDLDISHHGLALNLASGYEAESDRDSSSKTNATSPMHMDNTADSNVYDPFAESCIGCCFVCCEGSCKERSEFCVIESVFAFFKMLHCIYNSSNCVKGCVELCHPPIPNMEFKEPDMKAWISTCEIVNGELSETYYKTSEEEYDLFITYKDVLDIIIEEPSKSMILMKTPAGYFCNITETSSLLKEEIPMRSSVYFITVDYIHPNSSESISIDIDHDYYMCGNELLTPVFVMRYLKYNGLPFSMGYTLRIIDGQLNVLELNDTQYIFIEDAGYTVWELPSDNSSQIEYFT